ncbi:hypothetical protein ACHMW6_15415 [Pseudoduganella sp. UC29_106]|uniref:hypothetical protein n=1 Tax=Pseudoduganella sp. UC29_106 TaxID=3374553 RepID=UPI003757B9CA
MTTELKPAERRLLEAFRTMDRRAKRQTLLITKRLAANWPCGAAKAAMRERAQNCAAS